MRLLTFILSLLILVLSINSCAHGCSHEDHHHDEISTTHNHANEHIDVCPNACACEGCGIVITYEPIQSFDLAIYVPISTKVAVIYQSIYRFDFKSNIWQPPKLMSIYI